MSESKRILMILPTFNYAGGIETFVMNNLRQVNPSEYQIDILSHEITAKKYVSEVEAFGGRVFEFPKFTPKNFFKIKKRYIELLDNNRYDIIHCHMANAAFLYLKNAKRKGISVRILHSHQNKAADTFSHAVRNIPLLAVGKRFANYRMACTSLAGDFLFKQQNFDIVRNAIDYSIYSFDFKKRIQLRQELGISDEEIVIGHTGRLTPQKNQAYLIEILKSLVLRNLNYKLVLVGSGEDQDFLEAEVDKYNLKDKVLFLGDRSDVSDLLNVFDIFLFPSVYEGLGISILEAQANGLNSIASTAVPKDADISNYIVHLDLRDGSEKWCEIIEEMNASGRNMGKVEVKLDPKYDILRNAEVLYNLYESYLAGG